MNKVADLPLYCASLFDYQRRSAREVRVGKVGIGGNNPVRLQSMTTTSSMDTAATAAQCLRIVQAGGELVRITTQGRREAINLEQIKAELKQQGQDFPLVADVHFNPNAALLAAERVEKVRINPGNFADGAKKFRELDYDAERYAADLAEIETKLRPLLDLCKKHGTALRIGVNHGSLSDRIMARYGDTPEGMVASCMEFLRLCRKNDFHEIVLSIKASNTRVMVHTVRLLVATMQAEGMDYPLHLGVTEAGSGEDGRIKSAVGIGALLADGLGDTIRVSLTEDPEAELPVAALLRDYVSGRAGHAPIAPVVGFSYSPFAYQQRQSHPVGLFGGGQTAGVVPDLRGCGAPMSGLLRPEAVIVDAVDSHLPENWTGVQRWVPVAGNEGFVPTQAAWPLLDVKTYLADRVGSGPKVLELSYVDLQPELLGRLRTDQEVVLLLKTGHQNGTAEQRAFFFALQQAGLSHPVVLQRSYTDAVAGDFQLKAAADTGLLLLDGFGDGLSLSAPAVPPKVLLDTHFGVLQAARVRFSKTEFISCPGCGRTLFDLQETTRKVQARTGHLKDLKIAIMGCIVNGIGEMADADYGYVGAGPGKVSLFKNRELVVKTLPEAEAVDRLVELIKESGDWRAPG